MAADRAYFTDVSSDLQNNAAQAQLVIDRDKAASLGITADVLRSTLYGGFGAQQVSTIYTSSDSYEVIMELDPRIDWSPERLAEIKVATSTGTLVPIGAFARIERNAGLLTVNQLGQLPAVTISYNLPNGVALGDSIKEIDRLKTRLGVPQAVSTTFYGTAKTFEDAAANQGLLILGAIITIYIVLGILYESFVHPLTILSGLPAAAAGALLAIGWSGFDLSVIAVIGLLMLIGIVKKNAIMMIDVALTLRRDGASAAEAIYRACLMRFRPIMMTTFAAMMSTLPIAFGAGASAELRQPLGIAVVGGLIVSQTLTLFVTPVLYLYMERLSELMQRMPRWRSEQSPARGLALILLVVRVRQEPDVDQALAAAHMDRAVIDETGDRLVIVGAQCRLDHRRAGADVGIELLAHDLHAAGDVAGIADRREGQVALAADRPHHHRPELAADANVDRRQAGRAALAVPVVERGDHPARGPQRARRVVGCSPRHAERRHDAVADIVVDRSLVLEHHLLHAAVELAQHLEDLLRLMILRIGGEPDDIGEQHRDILPPDRAERLVVAWPADRPRSVRNAAPD